MRGAHVNFFQQTNRPGFERDLLTKGRRSRKQEPESTSEENSKKETWNSRIVDNVHDEGGQKLQRAKLCS